LPTTTIGKRGHAFGANALIWISLPYGTPGSRPGPQLAKAGGSRRFIGVPPDPTARPSLCCKIFLSTSTPTARKRDLSDGFGFPFCSHCTAVGENRTSMKANYLSMCQMLKCSYPPLPSFLSVVNCQELLSRVPSSSPLPRDREQCPQPTLRHTEIRPVASFFVVSKSSFLQL